MVRLDFLWEMSYQPGWSAITTFEGDLIMDSNDNQVKTILVSLWGAHFRLVGEENVQQIQEAVKAGTQVEKVIATAAGGDNFDLVESIKILYEGIQLINAILALYLGTKKILSKQELSQKIREAGLINVTTIPAVASKVEAVVDEILKQ